ncbi:hypothetical protein GCM10011345_12330 [Gemmobacter megaterium]|nr:hypothetical protein GCM10011345_12330 [Gemmobacter megaterium]
MEPDKRFQKCAPAGSRFHAFRRMRQVEARPERPTLNLAPPARTPPCPAVTPGTNDATDGPIHSKTAVCP